jgi:LysR family glycine cleavage system transcriptional activator
MHIPSLQTLRAFDAAGRHRSYSRAGEELGLTHSAISHRIRQLEALTGGRLFERQGNEMVPTQDGARLLAKVRNALGLLESIFAGDAPAARQPLTISVSPAFARFLVPRLGGFRAEHAEVPVRLDLSSDPVPLGGGIDAAIRYGEGPWPGTRSSRLGGEVLFPVCAPGHLPVATEPADLLTATLLRHPWHSWAQWFHAAGITASEPVDGPEYRDSSLLLAAAEAGEGVALARGLAAADALAAEALVRLPGPALADKYSYWLVRPAAGSDPRLDVVESWLKEALRQVQAA